MGVWGCFDFDIHIQKYNQTNRSYFIIMFEMVKPIDIKSNIKLHPIHPNQTSTSSTFIVLAHTTDVIENGLIIVTRVAKAEVDYQRI